MARNALHNVSGRTSRARRLRANQTDAERILWLRLHDRRLNGLKFRRQVPIDRNVVDFFCAEAHLVIEVDGGQHATADETSRTKFLEAMGYLVLRFWNNEVHENIRRSCGDDPEHARSARAPSPRPSPLRGPGRGRSAAAAIRSPNNSLEPRLSVLDRPEPPHPDPLPRGEREKRGCGDAQSNNSWEPRLSVVEPRLSTLDRSEPPHPDPLPCGERENNRRVR